MTPIEPWAASYREPRRWEPGATPTANTEPMCIKPRVPLAEMSGTTGDLVQIERINLERKSAKILLVASK